MKRKMSDIDGLDPLAELRADPALADTSDPAVQLILELLERAHKSRAASASTDAACQSQLAHVRC